MNQRQKRACGLLLGLGFAALNGVQAQDRSGQFELGGGAGLYRFDHDRGLENDSVFSIGGGYYFTNAWSAEFTLIENADRFSEDYFDLDSPQYRLDGLYHFGSLSRWLPYVAAGVGNLRVDPAAGREEEETLMSLGGGVKYLLGDSLTLRGDLRTLRGDDGAQDMAANFGLSVRLGGERAGVSGRDRDGDGVADVHDRCDWTPASASVDPWGCSPSQSANSDPWRIVD